MVIVQRFQFHTHVHKPEESVTTYVSELHHLSEQCEFGNTLADMLRDQLVCGISNGHIQHRLLAEPKLTFQKSLELSQAHEMAENDVLLESVTLLNDLHNLDSKEGGV